MTLLNERWPRLATLPRVQLAERPTPLLELRRLSEHLGTSVWCKRDDLTSALYGGNKVRKLEFLLAEAREAGADTILTAGALGSHHVLATALHGARMGMKVHAVVGPQPQSDHAAEVLRAQLAAGAQLHPVPVMAAMPAALAAQRAMLAMRGHKVRIIAPGGSEPSGVLGYIEAGLEIARSVTQGDCPEPEKLYVAFGTGGTAVGLAVGLAAAGIMARVCAVRVTPRGLVRPVALRALAHAVVERVRAVTDRFPPVAEIAFANLEIDDSQLGDGYGRATGASREAARLITNREQLELDQTYTAKAMASLIADARSRKVRRALFVHTLSSASMNEQMRGGPEPRAALERLWR